MISTFHRADPRLLPHRPFPLDGSQQEDAKPEGGMFQLEMPECINNCPPLDLSIPPAISCSFSDEQEAQKSLLSWATSCVQIDMSIGVHIYFRKELKLSIKESGD